MFMRLRALASYAAALALPLAAANLDFRNAVIVIPSNASAQERKTAQMLSEEIEKRTQLRLKVQNQASDGPEFVLARADQMKSLTPQLAGAPNKAEGYTIRSSADGSKAVAVATGFDDRGVLFGAGYLLRHMHMRRQMLEL